MGEFRGLAAVGGDEDLLQHLPLHRLLDDRHVAEPTIDALDAIAGDENERNFPRRQHVGDRVDEFSAEIDVNDARIDVVVHGSDHGLGQPAEGSDDRKSEFGQNVLHHHGDQNLVFDQKHAVAGLELKRKRRPVLAHRPMGAGTVRQRFDAVAAGHAHAAVQAFRPPMEGGLARELAFDAGADHPDAEARRGRRLRSRPAALGPAQEKAVRLQFPIHFHAPRHHRQRAVFGGIGAELVQRKRERLSGAWLERDVGAGRRDPLGSIRAVGGELFVDEAREIGALPAALREQRVRARQRADASVDRGDIGLDGVRAGQAHD